MKSVSASLRTFSVIMLVVYGIVAGVFWALHDRERCLMFLMGSIIWIVGIFIHNRNAEHGD